MIEADFDSRHGSIHKAKKYGKYRLLMKPGAPFYFSVPTPRDLKGFPLSKVLRSGSGRWSRRMWRAVHSLDPEGCCARAREAGPGIVRRWRCFSPKALCVLEWGCYFGAPTLLPHALFSRWIIASTRWNIFLTERGLRKYVQHPEHSQGTFAFHAIRKF